MEIIKIDNENISEIKPMWEGLNRLHGQLSTHFGDHFSNFTFEERVAKLQDKDSFAVLVARNEGDSVGYCIASVTGRNGEIDSIFTSSEYRQSGIGDKLMAKAEFWLKAEGVTRISVSIAEGNESVFGFYQKRGFHHRFTVFEKET